jgi:hypothetical protein
VAGGTFFSWEKFPQTPSKTRLKVILWGVAPNPTRFLEKASQKLLFAFGV